MTPTCSRPRPCPSQGNPARGSRPKPMPEARPTPRIAARLALIHQPNNPLVQPRAAVILKARWQQDRVTPPPADHLLLPAWPLFPGPPELSPESTSAIAAINSRLNASSIITGTGPAAFAGVPTTRSISTLIAGSTESSTCPLSRFVTTGSRPASPSSCSSPPTHPGHIVRHAAQNLAVKILHNLRPPLLPPRLR